MTATREDASPIDLETHAFHLSNSWVVLGLPDTQAQHDASLARRGLGVQIGWDHYAETVAFGDRAFKADHPLHGAHMVEITPVASGAARVVLPVCYYLRRRQLVNLRRLGLPVILGATRDDFLRAADAAFACGGLLSLVTHFEAERGLEFTDGFLAVDEIPRRRTPSGRGLLDAAACKAGEPLRRLKMALGPATWAYAPTIRIDLAATLWRRTPFWTSIIEGPASFGEHLRRANAWLRAVHTPEARERD